MRSFPLGVVMRTLVVPPHRRVSQLMVSGTV